MTDFIVNNDLSDPFRSFISKSRYARWIDEYGRRETWVETIHRYADFFTPKVDLSPEQKAELIKVITNHEVMPSMRSLMTAGEALERSNVAGYNPVTGDTKVLVRGRGMTPIAKLVDSDEQVLNMDGRWADAAFRSYGIQPTFTVSAQKNKTQQMQHVNASANHRWILSDGTVVPTSELKAGDRLAYASAPRPNTDNVDYELGLIHGLVYGDGTSTYSQERLRGYHIRLCGSSKELLPVFEKHGVVCYPPSANGDPVVMLYGTFAKTHSLKELPEPSETEEYLLGFMRGWLAADGSVSVGGQATLCANDAGYEWFKDNAGLVGMLHTGIQELNPTTNFGDRKSRTLSIRLDRASMVAEDFIITAKRERFEPSKTERYYTVKSVEATGIEEEVFCAEVPDTNTFVLDSGLVTGNCSFVAVNDPRAFDEALYILMCGTGLGFSAERRHTRYLPVVPEEIKPVEEVIVVHDSKEGWAQAYRELINSLYRGELPKWDLRQLRPEGARLKTFGGRSSGPEPLNELFEFTVKMFAGARGRKLKPIEVHEIMCKIGSVVVVGGVRRSALISLSSLSDDEIRDAKSGEWWNDRPHLALANNSAVYTTKPSKSDFNKEWSALVASGSGERGIFNLAGAREHVPARRNAALIEGTNPCAEILLRNMGFCNLTEVIVRETDTLDDLKYKVEMATKIGTWQSTLTNFPYLREEWKKNAEEERLLGVSLTGQMGHPVLNGREGRKEQVRWLREMKKVAIATNKKEARRLGINPAAAITTVKPSGTVSTLTNTSSGMHAWHDKFYIRTVRISKNDPIARFMEDAGVPMEEDFYNPKSVVFSFPFKAPDGALVRDDMTAIDQLEQWLVYKTEWTEHSPSVTVSVKPHEWEEVGEWVYEHFDKITGVSFLPHTDHTYVQAPFQSISEEEYETAKAAMPEKLDWEWLATYELEDTTSGSQTLACTAGECNVVDLVK